MSSAPEVVPRAASAVTVAICTHNGAARMPATLKHLAAQQAAPDLNWEVLVIDNASTDDSAAVARRCWPADAPAPLRVVREPRLGLSYARERAFGEARYEIIGFVDDDNWVAPDWVGIASEGMWRDPTIGVLGSFVEPVCESEPPRWFRSLAHLYGNSITMNLGDPPMPLGAGMCLRKSAWKDLTANGFRFATIGRQGARLSTGEDVELVCALLLAGWRAAVEPRLRVRHLLPAHRLEWSFTRRLAREGAASSVALDAYGYVSQSGATIKDRLRQHWLWHVAAELRHLVRAPHKTARALLLRREGDLEALGIEDRIGRVLGYWRLGRSYGEMRRTVRDASWRRLDSLPWYEEPKRRTTRELT